MIDRITLQTVGAAGLAAITSFAILAAACDSGPSGNQNGAPVVTITASPMSIAEGDNNTTVVTIDASASTDPDGDPLSFSWSIESATFVGSTTAVDPLVRVTFPGVTPSTATVEVADGQGGMTSASVTIGLIGIDVFSVEHRLAFSQAGMLLLAVTCQGQVQIANDGGAVTGSMTVDPCAGAFEEPLTIPVSGTLAADGTLIIVFEEREQIGAGFAEFGCEVVQADEQAVGSILGADLTTTFQLTVSCPAISADDLTIDWTIDGTRA